ncbi:hypothetical protein MNBD_GAMMA23-2299 [hydrothermal vent metagenome]|uniref:Uncharacterized protein n=1 Tax=hydrothermal vent metagenome TaxID=652676 RepID=A0A3B0ZS60_9ZZZZ
MIKGIYYNGKTSKKKDALLYCKHNGLIGFTDIEVAETPFHSVEISSRIGNTPRYLNFPDGAQFETNDNDAIDEIVDTFSNSVFKGLIHNLESAKSFVLFTVISVIVFGWLFIQYGIPFVSKEIAERLPEEASQYMGQGVLDIMDKQWFSETKLSKKKQTELQQLFDDLKINIDGSHYYKLVFRSGGSIGANAFALPDGTIVFTDELINLTDDNMDIAAIMLHEIGHLKNHHSLRATIQQSGLAIFIVAVTGDVSTSSSIITAIPFMLVQSGFSQDMETEADSYTLNYMQKYNIDPNHFANMMEKLVASFSDQYQSCIKESKQQNAQIQCINLAVKNKPIKDKKQSKELLDYFSTHPGSNDRIDRFRVDSR